MLTNSVTQYHLRSQLPAIRRTVESGVAAKFVIIPTHAVLQLLHETAEPKMVAVRWNEAEYLVFRSDLEECGRQIWP